MDCKLLQKQVKDFFVVYFDDYKASRCTSPEYALSHVREAITSQHMSQGRLLQFANIIKVIQQWQAAIMTK